MLYKTILAATLTVSVLAAPLERTYNDDVTQVYSLDDAEPTETAPVAEYTIPPIPVDTKTDCSTGDCTTPSSTPTHYCEAPPPKTCRERPDNGCGCPTGSCETAGCGDTQGGCVGKVETTHNPTGHRRRFFPSSMSHYDVSTGAIECRVNTGLIDKFYTNKGHDRTTLLTFTYPEAVKGRMCQFKFSLPASAKVSGSKKIDVYTSLAPAPGCTESWPPGNRRDRHLGRLSVERGKVGTWQSTYLSYLTTPTPCKAPNTVEAFELVGVHDKDHVSWDDIGSYGAQIVYF